MSPIATALEVWHFFTRMIIAGSVPPPKAIYVGDLFTRVRVADETDLDAWAVRTRAETKSPIFERGSGCAYRVTMADVVWRGRKIEIRLEEEIPWDEPEVVDQAQPATTGDPVPVDVAPVLAEPPKTRLCDKVATQRIEIFAPDSLDGVAYVCLWHRAPTMAAIEDVEGFYAHGATLPPEGTYPCGHVHDFVHGQSAGIAVVRKMFELPATGTGEPAAVDVDQAAKHKPSEVCDCPNPRPGKPWHCAATGTGAAAAVDEVSA